MAKDINRKVTIYVNGKEVKQSKRFCFVIAKRRSWSHATSTDSEGAEKPTTLRCGKPFILRKCDVQTNLLTPTKW